MSRKKRPNPDGLEEAFVNDGHLLGQLANVEAHQVLEFGVGLGREREKASRLKIKIKVLIFSSSSFSKVFTHIRIWGHVRDGKVDHLHLRPPVLVGRLRAHRAKLN
jgi:hypothetical protein